MNNSSVTSNLDYLSLHDCVVDDLKWDNGNLILYFENIDVLPTHPRNTYDVAKCSEEPRLIFKNCKVTDVFRSDTSNVASTKDQSVLVKMSFEEFIIDFEVLEVKFQRSFDKKKIYKIFGQCAYENNSDFGEFTISFDSVDIEWSDLTEDSWFVGFGE